MLRTEIENMIISACNANSIAEVEVLARNHYMKEEKDFRVKIFLKIIVEALGKDAGKNIVNECVSILHDYISKAIKYIFYSNNYSKQGMVKSTEMISSFEPIISVIKLTIAEQILKDLRVIPVLGTYDADEDLLTPNEEGIKEFMKLYTEDHPGKL